MKTFTKGSDEKLNKENIVSTYSDVVLPDRATIHTCDKLTSFTIIHEFTDKYIKFLKCSCVLNCCSECPGVFLRDAEIIGDKDMDLPLIIFNHYENITSFNFHKQILPKHGKTCILCINIENFDKGNVTTRKSIVLKSCSIFDSYP